MRFSTFRSTKMYRLYMYPVGKEKSSQIFFFFLEKIFNFLVLFQNYLVLNSFLR